MRCLLNYNCQLLCAVMYIYIYIHPDARARACTCIFTVEGSPSSVSCQRLQKAGHGEVDDEFIHALLHQARPDRNGPSTPSVATMPGQWPSKQPSQWQSHDAAQTFSSKTRIERMGAFWSDPRPQHCRECWGVWRPLKKMCRIWSTNWPASQERSEKETPPFKKI